MDRTNALVLFDIDGTLIRRAGEHHRQALVDAVFKTTGIETTTEGVPVAGMLDHQILRTMMSQAGMKPGLGAKLDQGVGQPSFASGLCGGGVAGKRLRHCASL